MEQRLRGKKKYLMYRFEDNIIVYIDDTLTFFLSIKVNLHFQEEFHQEFSYHLSWHRKPKIHGLGEESRTW